MCTLLKVVCMNSLKKRITLPKDWFQITEDYMLFSYFIDGKMRFLQVERGEEAAEFLREQGMIQSYEGHGKNLKMYNQKVFMVGGKKGQIRWVRSSVLDWEKIKFFESDALHIAATNEYELTASTMGLVKAKVRSMFTEHYIQAA